MTDQKLLDTLSFALLLAKEILTSMNSGKPKCFVDPGTVHVTNRLVDKALFSSEICWYLSYFYLKAYVVGTL